MFVKIVNMTVKTVLAVTAYGLITSQISLADEAAAVTAPLNVEIDGVQKGGGPLYVSVQKRADFEQPRGSAGGVYTVSKAGQIAYHYQLAPGAYSVMIWHDSNNDGRFSKDADGKPLDGWGASGPKLHHAPSFDDVKIIIPATGKTVHIKMQYPH